MTGNCTGRAPLSQNLQSQQHVWDNSLCHFQPCSTLQKTTPGTKDLFWSHQPGNPVHQLHLRGPFQRSWTNLCLGTSALSFTPAPKCPKRHGDAIEYSKVLIDVHPELPQCHGLFWQYSITRYHKAWIQRKLRPCGYVHCRPLGFHKKHSCSFWITTCGCSSGCGEFVRHQLPSIGLWTGFQMAVQLRNLNPFKPKTKQD